LSAGRQDPSVARPVRAALVALRACLLTAPRYPAGHARVVQGLRTLRRELQALDGPLDLEIREQALHVDGAEVASADVSAALPLVRLLWATGVRRLALDHATPDESLLALARRLNENALRARQGGVAASDLWRDPPRGLVVETQVAHREGYGGPGGGPDLGGTSGGGGSGGEDDEGDGDGTRLPPAPSSELRRAMRRDLEVRSLLTHVNLLVRDRAKASPAAPGTLSDADLLDRVTRFLPLEVRMDPGRAVVAVRKVLERYASILQSPVAGAGGGEQRVLTHLAKTVSSFFARIGDPLSEKDAKVAATAPRKEEPQATTAEVAREMERAAADGPPPVHSETGVLDAGAVLLHAVLEERPGKRRDDWARQLAQQLRDPLAHDEARCLGAHLLAAAKGAGAEDDRVALLTRLALESGRGEVLRSSGALPLARVARTFPELLRAYCLVTGGRASDVGRAVGWKRVLDAADGLLGADGLLADPAGVDHVLEERSPEALPFVAVHLRSPSPDLRRVVRMLRAMELRTRAGGALRVLPPEAVTADLLSAICADEFERVDTGRGDALAVSAIDRWLATPGPGSDERAFVVGALAGFPRALVEPVLRRLFRRRMGVLPVEPRVVRRRAAEVAGSLPEDAARIPA
jgi:hypothetical protein